MVITRKDEEILRMNRRVLEESPDLISVIGPDYHYYYVNPAYASVHGHTVEDFTGRHINVFLGEEVFSGIVKPRLDRCFKGEDVHYEECFDFPETGVLYMDVRYLPLRDDSGDVDRIVIILRNISYMKEAEEARIGQEKLKTIVELAGTYNHEINNPLCSLAGYLELLKQKETDSGKLSYLEKALCDVDRITGVTKKISQTTSVSLVEYPGGQRILDIDTEAESAEK